MDSKKLAVYAFPGMVLLIILALGQGTGIGSLNSAFALASVVVLGITFLIGPMSRFSGKVNRLKIYRKFLGLAGFALLLVHVLLAFGASYGYEISRLLSLDSPKTLRAYAGLAGFVIFFLMAVTSSTAAIRLMGPRRWKLLQNTGYVAMALAVLHFILANTGSSGVFHIGRLHALIILLFGIAVILLRLLVLALVFADGLSRKR